MLPLENQLTTLSSPTTYLYSDDGHRQVTINSSGTTNFVYDGDIILQETNAGGVTQVQYTQGPGTWGELSAQKRGSAIQILASDDRQNVRLVLGSSGAIMDYNQYKAFLEQLNTPTQTIPFLGWGNDNVYAEVLGLLRTGHRLIVPPAARFLDPDPLGIAGGDNNWFRLVKNNPLAWTDPSGLDDCAKLVDCLATCAKSMLSAFLKTGLIQINCWTVSRESLEIRHARRWQHLYFAGISTAGPTLVKPARQISAAHHAKHAAASRTQYVRPARNHYKTQPNARFLCMPALVTVRIWRAVSRLALRRITSL